jgi:hypothetical protein
MSTKKYIVEFDETVPTATGAYTAELTERKTFNIFRAWNTSISPEKYGLYWTHDIYDELPGKFSLETPGWNYHYVGKTWNNYPGIEQFVRKGVNWGHGAEYGTTLATDYTNPEFHDYFAELVASLNSDVDGILLDWWHDNHYEINSKSAVAKARKQIAQHVREKMGDDFLLVGNVNWDKDTATIENLNGVFLELYKPHFNAYTSIEIDTMVDVLTYYENELQYPKLIAFEPWRVSQQSKSNSKSLTEDRLTPENQKFAKLFATILNVHTSNGYYLYADSNDDTEDGDHGHAWYSFYDLDIGKPTSKGVEVANRIGVRKYEKGLLGYNYTSRDIDIVTPNGTIKIPSQGGEILYLVGGEYQPISFIGEVTNKIYSGNSSEYKFYNLGSGKFGVGTTSGIDELTGVSILKFDDKDMSLESDIKGTFDQVTGLNTDSGKMFRLYNASFKRLPDPDGLRYWIDNFSSGKDDERAVASSFLASAEFKQRYGENVSDSTYVNTLYKNVLGRDADTGGLNYWLGQLNNGAETRYEVLLGFSESAENKTLFTEMTGFG